MKPIQHTISATSASDFDNWLTQTDPFATSDPMFLADGDSWFNKFYPARGNMLEQIDLNQRCRILDHSWSGDKADGMFAPHRIAAVAQYLDLYQFQAILLSAGGNDIIGNVGDLLTTTGNTARLADNKVIAAFDNVEQYLRAFCDARTTSSRNKNTRIFIHAYDFVVPRNAPVKGKIAGPWVYPRLMTQGVTNQTVQKNIVSELLTRWLARLSTLADPNSAQHIAGLHVFLTQGILTPANPNDTGRSADWEDEIHPTINGYRKITTQLVNPTLNAILAGA